MNKEYGKCQRCETTRKEDIVWSGVDAFMLGIPNAETGTYCERCARALQYMGVNK